MPTTEKPAPETEVAEIFATFVPVFLIIRLCVALLPTDTFPKLAPGVAERIAELRCCDGGVPPVLAL